VWACEGTMSLGPDAANTSSKVRPVGMSIYATACSRLENRGGHVTALVRTASGVAEQMRGGLRNYITPPIFPLDLEG